MPETIATIWAELERGDETRYVELSLDTPIEYRVPPRKRTDPETMWQSGRLSQAIDQLDNYDWKVYSDGVWYNARKINPPADVKVVVTLRTFDPHEAAKAVQRSLEIQHEECLYGPRAVSRPSCNLAEVKVRTTS